MERRIRNRMISLGLQDSAAYLECLRANGAETAQLVERVTIKVSRFYRNRVTFDSLRTEVLPALVASTGGRPLRIWSAGCAFGEEPYTLAMLLDELGRKDVIDATDIDPVALERASAAHYLVEALEELPEELRERYLEPVIPAKYPTYRVRDFLRSRVRFHRHDLTALEPPPGGAPFDLVCCRNVLIYLQRGSQEVAFSKVLGTVAPGGALCLGEAEWPPPAHARLLRAMNRRTRIFWTQPSVSARCA